ISRAGLSDVVLSLPEGLDTVLGERGAGLSAGERQRIALARAFLRDAPLVLLDEPTANLDGETERDLVESIRRLCEGRTAVLVARRPRLGAIGDRVPSRAPVEVAAGGRRPSGTRHPRLETSFETKTDPRLRCLARSRSRGPPRGAWLWRRSSARA